MKPLPNRVRRQFAEQANAVYPDLSPDFLSADDAARHVHQQIRHEGPVHPYPPGTVWLRCTTFIGGSRHSYGLLPKKSSYIATCSNLMSGAPPLRNVSVRKRTIFQRTMVR